MVDHYEALRMARSWAEFVKAGAKSNTPLYDSAKYDIIRIDAALRDLAKAQP